MKKRPFTVYYMLSCLGVLIASYYPLSMGVRVICDMVLQGAVDKENYPKYIIPYTPICIAVILGTLLMPLCIRLFKKYALVGGFAVSTFVFFVTELLFEHKIVVSTAETTAKLEDWQMYMCYIPPEGWGETVTSYKTQTAVDILMGDYDPAFKLHFYAISLVLIITVLNCLYGFGQMIKNKDTKRLNALILQAVCSLSFLGLCILACFTAFWRDGSISVSPLSAVLMAIFFILFGVTCGVFLGSFLLGKSKLVSIWLPSIAASVMTLLMYAGEMILLRGHLYSFGPGIMFKALPLIVFAPIDLLIIAASGCITLLIFSLLCHSRINIKKLIISAAVAASVILFLLFVPLGGNDSIGENVRLIDKISDGAGSSYQIEAVLPEADFSVAGKTLSDKISEQWETYDSMSVLDRGTSGKLWGIVEIQTDTWSECEDIIGFAVNNPLETMDQLHKTGYIGMESVVEDIPAEHIQIIANTAVTSNRDIGELSITAGYETESARVTLTSTLSASGGSYFSGASDNCYAVYGERTVETGSGICALTVTTQRTNNTGYYNASYFDMTAYWVKDKVLYTLRVFGEETNKNEIIDAFDEILKGV